MSAVFRHLIRRFSALALLGVAGLCLEAAAQTGEAPIKTLEMVRTTVPPTIDGHLDEATRASLRNRRTA